MPVDITNPKPGVEAASLTDVGLQRDNNEDSYLYWEPEQEDEFLRKGRLAIVADGMGGYEGGQEASRLAVETARHVYDHEFSGSPQAALSAGLQKAHDAIQSYALEHTEFSGMGTTCTALAIVDHQLFFAHVGDSRLYLLRGENMQRLTRDHSYVGRLVETGIVSSEEAESHPQRHILTAALGSGRELVPDEPAHPIPLQDRDLLILCTDGLWSVVSERQLSEIANANPPAEACRKLVRAALELGAPDNVTVIILRFAQ